MPAVSKRQALLMNAVKHNKKFAKEVSIKQSVGRDFSVGGAAYQKLPKRVKNGKAVGRPKTKTT